MPASSRSTDVAERRFLRKVVAAEEKLCVSPRFRTDHFQVLRKLVEGHNLQGQDIIQECNGLPDWPSIYSPIRTSSSSPSTIWESRSFVSISGKVGRTLATYSNGSSFRFFSEYCLSRSNSFEISLESCRCFPSPSFAGRLGDYNFTMTITTIFAVSLHQRDSTPLFPDHLQ